MGIQVCEGIDPTEGAGIEDMTLLPVSFAFFVRNERINETAKLYHSSWQLHLYRKRERERESVALWKKSVAL